MNPIPLTVINGRGLFYPSAAVWRPGSMAWTRGYGIGCNAADKDFGQQEHLRLHRRRRGPLKHGGFFRCRHATGKQHDGCDGHEAEACRFPSRSEYAPVPAQKQGARGTIHSLQAQQPEGRGRHGGVTLNAANGRRAGRESNRCAESDEPSGQPGNRFHHRGGWRKIPKWGENSFLNPRLQVPSLLARSDHPGGAGRNGEPYHGAETMKKLLRPDGQGSHACHAMIPAACAQMSAVFLRFAVLPGHAPRPHGMTLHAHAAIHRDSAAARPLVDDANLVPGDQQTVQGEALRHSAPRRSRSRNASPDTACAGHAPCKAPGCIAANASRRIRRSGARAACAAGGGAQNHERGEGPGRAVPHAAVSPLEQAALPATLGHEYGPAAACEGKAVPVANASDSAVSSASRYASPSVRHAQSGSAPVTLLIRVFSSV